MSVGQVIKRTGYCSAQGIIRRAGQDIGIHIRDQEVFDDDPGLLDSLDWLRGRRAHVPARSSGSG